MASTKNSLGRLQLRIMQILWARGQATAREITAELNETQGASAEVAHSTVQTLLRKLEAKGAVTHQRVERTFIFKPLQAEDEVTRSATHDLLGRLFNHSVPGLVAHLLQHERVAPDELKRIRQLIDEAQRS